MARRVSRHIRWGLAGVVALLGAPARPAVAGPPFRTDDPVPVAVGHYEINLFSAATAAGNAWAGSLASIEVNYGALPDLQLHVLAPEAFATEPNGKTAFGAGNLELGAKYRVFTPDDASWYPQVAIYPTVELPVANAHRFLGSGRAQVYLPVWLEKDWGDWSLYGGGGFWLNPGVGNRNYGFAGVALWRRVAANFNVGVEGFGQTRSAAGVPAATGFDAGAIYDFSAHWHLLASAGTGVTRRRTTNQVSYYLGVQLTF